MADSASAAEASPRARRRGTALGASSSRKHPFHQVGKSMKKVLVVSPQWQGQWHKTDRYAVFDYIGVWAQGVAQHETLVGQPAPRWPGQENQQQKPVKTCGGMMKDVFIHCRPPSFNPLRFITVRGPPLLSRRSGPPGQVTEALEALPQIHHLKHQPGTCAARNRWRELGPLLRPGLCLAAACSFDRIK